MKDVEVFLKLQELSKKYESIGIMLDIEFNRYGMVFRGYWLRKGVNEVIRYNRIHKYDLIKGLPNDIDVEFLVDKFKEEFENKLKEDGEKDE